MINSIDEFKKVHPKSVVVNYDIADIFDFGMTYRTKTGNVEIFRKERSGKYITYPFIQPYLTLSSDYELFIIHNKKMYKLEQGSKENTYHIKEEMTDINILLFDDLFYDKRIRKNPTIIDENIYTIEE